VQADVLARLVEGLRDDLALYERLRNEIKQAQSHVAERVPEQYDLRAIASMIHDLYRGAEGMMRRIAKDVDRDVPTGEHWHRQLLDQMAAPVADLRPAVFGDATIAQLERYRVFRHVQRNIYGFDLLWPQMAPLFKAADEVMVAVTTDIHDFMAFLSILGDDP
jgi:hypothetical protein